MNTPDLLQRLAQGLADRYHVQRELGAGGMATVWLAQDLRHEREVAIKVLHPDLGAALGGERFLAEIKTTAKLQHPHILPLLDSGETDGLLYYVMPYVRGESLRARLEREHPLPIAEALRIAREIGSALDYAHRHGVVHRDIKPENILLHDGQAMVADFGIALAVQTAGGARMTQTGLSLGTPQYMSPEQAMGERQLDARADVYALGAVTYEMLAGEPPFTGASVQAIVAKVLSERPIALRTLRDTVPPGVEHAVLEALAKLPADRPATAAAFVAALEAGGSSGGRAFVAATAQAARGGAMSRRALQLAVAGNVLLAAVAAALWLRPAPGVQTSRQQVVLWSRPVPDVLLAGATYIATQAAIAPDGSSIVFSDSTSAGRMLFRKRRAEAHAEPMAGTELGVSPSFSPDGAWVLFSTLDGRLRKVPISGGTAVTIAEDMRVDYKVAGWLDDGSIVYTNTSRGVALLSPDGIGSQRLSFPANAQGQLSSLSSLPGDRGFIGGFCLGNCAFGSDVFVYDRKTDSMRVLVPNASAGWYSPTGHLLYTAREGGLFAAEFDLTSLTTIGQGFPVIDGVSPGSVALSREGHLLYALRDDLSEGSELVWVDRSGQESSVDAGWRGRFEYPAVSPDGKSIAVSVRDRVTDLWIRDGAGVRRKVIASGVANWRPSWAADGSEVLFVSINTGQDAGGSSVMRVRADAAEPAVTVYRRSPAAWEAERTPDGQLLAFRIDEPVSSSNIYFRRLDGDSTVYPFATDSFPEITLNLSPDGRFITYTAQVQGVSQVFVATFPDGRVRRMVSRSGGWEPRFARSGREVFFESAGRLWSVRLSGDADITAGEPQPLFTLGGYRRARNRQQYDVAPGDQRFLMIKDPPPPPVPPLVYVENWFPELRARLRQ